MLIRPAADADLAQLLELDEIARRGDEHRRRFIEERLAQGQMLVAEHDGRVAGYAVFDRSFFEHGFVHMLYVGEQDRGHGTGAALLGAAATACATSRVFTSTNLSNRPMQHLLRREGWISSGTVYGLDEGDPELFSYVDAG